MLYNSNFDNSSFTDINEFNRTIDDPCFIQQHTEDNLKKLKFITTNHRDLIDGKENLNFFGMTVRDQLFVPSNQIDTFSMLRQGETGNVITNCNVRNEYGQLPFPTMPSKYQSSHGDVSIESELTTSNYQVNRKTCNPRDNKFFDRSFYIFENVETPNALNSVETDLRCGVSTRFSKK
jgi:hypothetical protein